MNRPIYSGAVGVGLDGVEVTRRCSSAIAALER